MKFPKFKEESNFEMEKRMSKYWKEINLLERSVKERNDAEKFVFYEGPPTANGTPGIHHVMARTLKDAVCRYKTMQGYQVKRKAGWDTHGLPVEIEVEKQLGLTSKQEIEEYGIGNFNEKCRESVFKYEEQWREMTEQMGYLLDLDDPYITLDNDYIESVWWILDQFHKKEFIYEGHRILPYCPRCGTGLATHEVAQGYEEITSETVISRFKAVEQDAYFLAWTTTPWTLASNVTLSVHPEIDYVKVLSEKDGKYYILAEALVDKVIIGEYQVVEKFKGKELEYLKYEQLMPFIETNEKAFYVTLADYVTTEDGTGIVHTAPAFGQDDYETGEKYGLPIFQPVDPEGKYTTTPWEGQFVMDADPLIVEWLRDNDKLYSKQRMEHNYPHCWRCSTPLIYYARQSWYIEMTKIKDELIKTNQEIEWYPDYIGERRFGNWLENLNDWALSRSRYWGTPLNIWKCECGHFDTVSSREDLKDRAIEDVSLDIELHRPYVDDIHIKCDKCNGLMVRVPDVVDCWFDSGAMPFAQHHYPFENEEIFFDELYPADFISEAIDQTRGWFYSLLAISVFLTGTSSYKRVLVTDLILDKEGSKMSKSKGNTVDPFEMFEKYGADAVRWYLLHSSPPWLPKSFDPAGVGEVISKYFNTLKNVYTFFELYANTDNIDPREFDVPYNQRPEIDRWLLSKYNNLIKTVTESTDKYDLTVAVRAIQHFVNEDLSNWYIRRNRRRFWSSELDLSKKSVYATTYEVLLGVAKLMAPFAPFTSELLFGNLTDEVSVHLSKLPEVKEEMIDERTEKRMDLVRNLVKLGRSARESVNIKVRQPISQVLVDGRHQELIGDMTELIKEELNVKDVAFAKDLSQYMKFNLKPNFRIAGPKFQNKVGLFTKALGQLNAFEVASALEDDEKYLIEFDGKEIALDNELVQVELEAREGFNVRLEKNIFIILDITLTEELLSEGMAREFVSKVQQIRKNHKFDVTDNINVFYQGEDKVKDAITNHKEWVMKETLALSIIEKEHEKSEEIDLNGCLTEIFVEKV